MSLMIVSFVVILFWDKIPKKRKNVKLFGFQDDWFLDLLKGLGAFVVLLLFRSILPFGWVIPRLQPLATTPQLITWIGIAPLSEEIFFRVFLMGVFFIVFGWSYFVSAFLTSIGFSLYHISAYAGEIALDPVLAVGGAFVTAAMMGFAFAYINKWTGSISASIGTHAGLNFAAAVTRLVFF